jgi:dUTPase
MKIEIIKSNDNVVIEKAHSLDIGYDVYAQSVEWKEEYGAWIYDTGIRVDLPKDIVCNVVPNSGIYKRNGFLPNTPGIVDPGYQGTIKVIYKPLIPVEISERIANFANSITMLIDRKIDSEKDKCDLHIDCDCLILLIDKYRKPPFEIGEKIGQLIFNRTISPNFVEVDKFDTEYSRGENGLGSFHKENKEKIKANLKVFVTEGCHACQIMLSVINEFIFRNKDKFEFKLDIIKNTVESKVDNVTDFPTIILKDEEYKELFRIEGTCSVDELTKLLIKKC